MRTLYFYHEIEDMYEEMLDECHEAVNICGYNYDAGRALRLIDEVAFRCGVSDWSSEEYQELWAQEMSQEELDHYILSDNQVMYCHVNDCEEE